MRKVSAKRITLISTGGTIEKTYDELSGVLENTVSVLDIMLAQLEIRGVALERVRLMNKDSLQMTEEDHLQIADAALSFAKDGDGVVIVHGTDRLANTGERILERGAPHTPVVLTGAMRPHELKSTDALQNLTEALLTVQLVPPGVYLAMHNQVLAFPGVRKDRDAGSFSGGQRLQAPKRPGR